MSKLIIVCCRLCDKWFCICQCCWRGQAYCSAPCRRAGRLRSHREAQWRYRKTEKGRKAHRLAENRRRHREKTPVSKNMDDASSKSGFDMQTWKSRRENSADFHPDFQNRCHFCGLIGEIVPKFPRRRYGNRVFDENYQQIRGRMT